MLASRVLTPLLCALAIEAALFSFSAPSAADSTIVPDANDVDTSLDISKIRSGHWKSKLLFRVNTYRRWEKEDLWDNSFSIFFNTDSDGKVERYLSVQYDRDSDSLIGEMHKLGRKRPAPVIGHARITRPRSNSFRAVFRRSLLRRNLRRFRWSARSDWSEHDHPCRSSEGGCTDRAPDSGRVEHRM
jgi:hypothetical protein